MTRRERSEGNITARPKGMREETTGRHARGEAGLSVDADELGRRFLAEATEQGNFESTEELEDDLYLHRAAASDEPLPGPNYEADRSIWENTVSLSLQSGDAERARLEADPPVPSDDPRDQLRGLDEEAAADGLDLTDTTIREGSLLDAEREQGEESVAPALRTDDAHTHGRPRGGHARGR